MSNGYSPSRTQRISKPGFSLLLQDDSQTILKSGTLRTSKFDTYRSNKLQLFAEQKKQNCNIISQLTKTCSKQFVEQICNQHRLQVQKLLLQISRLHNIIHDQERQSLHKLHKTKQEVQQKTRFQINQLKIQQTSEIRVLEQELKKHKFKLQEAKQKSQNSQKSLNREIQILNTQNQQLKNDLKSLLIKKNGQIDLLNQKKTKQCSKVKNQGQETIQIIRKNAQKQFNKLNKRLEQRQKMMQELKWQLTHEQQEKSCLQTEFASAKLVLQSKIQRIMMLQKDRQIEVMQNFKNHYQKKQKLSQSEIQKIKKCYQKQIQFLKKTLLEKKNNMKHTQIYYETKKVQVEFLTKYFEKQSDYLRMAIKKQRQNYQRQIQMLKVKMSVLHQNDIKQITRLHESKIVDFSQTQQHLQKLLLDKENQLMEEYRKHYEVKKKYERDISSFKEQIFKLTNEKNMIETGVKQKTQNEKSMLLLTSRNYIKQLQSKNANSKVSEQQVRKLRNLIDLQEQQADLQQKNIEEKIRLAQDQLTRLSNKILQQKAESQQMQKKYKQIIQAKDSQIRRLNSILNHRNDQIRQQLNQNDMIMELQKKIANIDDQYQAQKMKTQHHESEIKQLKARIQTLIIQNQINSEDAKNSYHALSDKNMSQMKLFYQRRLKQLQNDKVELQKVNTSQSQHISGLLAKYRQLQSNLSELLKQSKKRQSLQQMIINLGMDNNLVKNMVELFKK